MPREILANVLMVVGVAAMSALITIILAGMASQIGFPADVAKIEMVRTNLAEAQPGDRAELIKEAVDWNQKIVACRYWNSVWWTDIVFADGCNDLELIAVD